MCTMYTKTETIFCIHQIHRDKESPLCVHDICMEAERAYPVSTIYMEAGAASGRRKELGEGIEMGHKEERNRERSRKNVEINKSE